MKRLLVWLLLLGLFTSTAALAETLTVGIYPNPPKVFWNSSGQASGIDVDLLREIARAENWKLQFVHCEWEACLDALAEGRIDMVPDVAYTDERSRRFDFHRIPVLHSWSQIYRRPDVTIRSVWDLNGKRVAALGGSVQAGFLATLLQNFGVHAQLIPARSPQEAFELVRKGKADAVVSEQFFGSMQATRSNLVGTPVVFQPVRLFYAATKGRHQAKLDAIDRHLAVWQGYSDSVYFQILRRWQAPAPSAAIGPALWWALAAVLGLLLTSLMAASWLRRQVATRTRQLGTSERRLSTILDSVESLIYIKDKNYRYRYVNGAMCRLLGKSADEIIGKDDYQLFDKPVAAATHETDMKVIERGERIVAEEIGLGEGQHSTFLCTKIPLSENGKVYALCAIATDITQRKRVEESLRIAATVFQSQEGMFVLNPDKRVMEVNNAYRAMTGYGPEELAGKVLPHVSLEPDGPDFSDTIWQIVGRSNTWQGEIWTRRKNGEHYPAWLTISAVQDANGQTNNYVGTQADITQQKQAQDRIVQLAYYDALTGLPNRRLLRQRIEHSLAFNHRSKQIAALLVLDLDNFKDLNDTRGHVVGDQLLQQVAERILSCARESDTVARFGGDEFVVLLEAVGTGEEEATMHAEAIGWKLLGVIAEPYVIAGMAHHTTCSIGVTLCAGQEVPIDDVMKRGDLAMYEAKKDGRNTVRLFHGDMEALVSYRTALESELREALRRAQFTLHYQGQVSEAGGLIGAEALLRWHHPLRGIVGPDSFIPIAETSGLILPLGRWVLRTACIQLARWAESPHTAHLTLAVNVSVRQFQQPDFVAHTLALIAETGADPARLKLELTESLLVERVEETIEKMRQLKEHGVSFSLDDFGTGYSSLSYLKRLPLDQLKIDRSFVSDVLVNPNDASIAQSVVALGKAFGLGIVAEGVETEAQRAFLAQIGCDAYQGYLFSRPVEAEELEALIA